ncbi:hypothetical protein NDU88_006635 [Pleurodeles waltl]|uniref:Uncharacterized protein n=1 Tax=Pleurodeles waltl TaxID=8319 RepID=A0AAV7SQ72_PLEWA|nr:hypothetical protein NDU88_006635 [Pleurodeles waltl]
MPGGRSSKKHLYKPARQLLFYEALRHSRTLPPASKVHPASQFCNMGDTSQGATMDRILQEISAVGCRLEGMDSMMASLTEHTKSMRLDIAGFQSRVTALEQRMTTVEPRSRQRPRDPVSLQQGYRSRREKCRDNVRFVGFPETIEGADVQSFLKTTLPQLTGLTFDPPPEFQRAHRLGPKRRYGDNHPRPIIACFLRHVPAQQLLQKARMEGPFRMNDQLILTSPKKRANAEKLSWPYDPIHTSWR